MDETVSPGPLLPEETSRDETIADPFPRCFVMAS